MASARPATILHADLDAFYASVEQLLDPSLRGRPIAVGGGVVLAASYEARTFGVGAGMPGWRARQLCPSLTFVSGHFPEYQRLGDEVIDVLHDFTPSVERISIDEAFLDVAGAVHLFGSPTDIAVAIRRRVRDEIGLPVSVGVARTKHLAKVASQVAKPDGVVVVAPEREREFLEHLPVELMWGVGPVTKARLAGAGIRSIGDLVAASGTLLDHLLGKSAGARLASLAVNVDARRIETVRRAASMGAQAALGRRRATTELLRSTLGYLADRVAGRLRAAGWAGRTVTVRVRFTGLRSVTRSATAAGPDLRHLDPDGAGHRAGRCRSGGPSRRARRSPSWQCRSPTWCTNRPCSSRLPFDLGDDRYRPGRRQERLDGAWIGRWTPSGRRFGHDAVRYATVMFSDVDRVPEAFRELGRTSPVERVNRW